eukprot:TRINITY_DN3192_c0_g1_i1.p1 TRINITY_DN3192_c0_g1~~TRINITY_DN3192_c0_g1_i1.p1  ORF type:complete len:227 (-),score=29.37 TRINITY_DN3192_c0_g1_i1:182-862(-)
MPLGDAIDDAVGHKDADSPVRSVESSDADDASNHTCIACSHVCACALSPPTVRRLSLSIGAGFICLNIGGKIYWTTRSTLCRDKNSMLAAMFGGRHSGFECERDDRGAHLIDRDGTYFSYVLNYLRDGEIELMPDEHKLALLLREAKFYQVAGLVKIIDDTLAKKREGRHIGRYALVQFHTGDDHKQSEIQDIDCTVLNHLTGQGYCVEGFAGSDSSYLALVRKQL